MKNKKVTKLDLASFNSTEARELIEKVVFNDKPEEIGKALLLLWCTVDKIIKHLKENEK
jgi:hypothetical protein